MGDKKMHVWAIHLLRIKNASFCCTFRIRNLNTLMQWPPSSLMNNWIKKCDWAAKTKRKERALVLAKRTAPEFVSQVHETRRHARAHTKRREASEEKEVSVNYVAAFLFMEMEVENLKLDLLRWHMTCFHMAHFSLCLFIKWSCSQFRIDY